MSTPQDYRSVQSVPPVPAKDRYGKGKLYRPSEDPTSLIYRSRDRVVQWILLWASVPGSLITGVFAFFILAFTALGGAWWQAAICLLVPVGFLIATIVLTVRLTRKKSSCALAIGLFAASIIGLVTGQLISDLSQVN